MMKSVSSYGLHSAPEVQTKENAVVPARGHLVEIVVRVADPDMLWSRALEAVSVLGRDIGIRKRDQ